MNRYTCKYCGKKRTADKQRIDGDSINSWGYDLPRDPKKEDWDDE